jgi:uncharacterized membrane protein YsdA (DUF1294 family)
MSNPCREPALSSAPILSLLPLHYAALSLLTLLVYAWDKSAARRRAWRISEATLHGLALLGGWPGAWLAQVWLRHKSRKQPFRTWFWLMVAANLAALALLLWWQGQDGGFPFSMPAIPVPG